MHWDMYWERHSGIKAIFTGSLVPPPEMIYFVSYIVIVLNEMFFFYFLVNGYIYIYIKLVWIYLISNIIILK